MKNKTVAISYGWSGGKWHTKNFANSLKEAGFKLINGINKADIIIAHSAGCYRLPKSSRASLVILIGPPYWPEKSIARRLLKKIRSDTRHIIKHHGISYTIKKFIWAIIYILLKPSLTIAALINHRRLDFLEELKDRKVIMVRNEEDHTCSPDIETAVKKLAHVHYLKMPGHHDDYYTNPQPYIDLLLKQL